jgi:hypothetical protein
MNEEESLQQPLEKALTPVCYELFDLDAMVGVGELVVPVPPKKGWYVQASNGFIYQVIGSLLIHNDFTNWYIAVKRVMGKADSNWYKEMPAIDPVRSNLPSSKVTGEEKANDGLLIKLKQ